MVLQPRMEWFHLEPEGSHHQPSRACFRNESCSIAANSFDIDPECSPYSSSWPMVRIQVISKVDVNDRSTNCVNFLSDIILVKNNVSWAQVYRSRHWYHQAHFPSPENLEIQLFQFDFCLLIILFQINTFSERELLPDFECRSTRDGSSQWTSFKLTGSVGLFPVSI